MGAGDLGDVRQPRIDAQSEHESLCGTSISKSSVSRLITQLDVRVSTFNERRLDDGTYLLIYVDAMFIKCRHNNRIARRRR